MQSGKISGYSFPANISVHKPRALSGKKAPETTARTLPVNLQVDEICMALGQPMTALSDNEISRLAELLSSHGALHIRGEIDYDAKQACYRFSASSEKQPDALIEIVTDMQYSPRQLSVDFQEKDQLKRVIVNFNPPVSLTSLPTEIVNHIGDYLPDDSSTSFRGQGLSFTSRELYGKNISRSRAIIQNSVNQQIEAFLALKEPCHPQDMLKYLYSNRQMLHDNPGMTEDKIIQVIQRVKSIIGAHETFQLNGVHYSLPAQHFGILCDLVASIRDPAKQATELAGLAETGALRVAVEGKRACFDRLFNMVDHARTPDGQNIFLKNHENLDWMARWCQDMQPIDHHGFPDPSGLDQLIQFFEANYHHLDVVTQREGLITLLPGVRDCAALSGEKRLNKLLSWVEEKTQQPLTSGKIVEVCINAMNTESVYAVFSSEKSVRQFHRRLVVLSDSIRDTEEKKSVRYWLDKHKPSRYKQLSEALGRTLHR